MKAGGGGEIITSDKIEEHISASNYVREHMPQARFPAVHRTRGFFEIT